MKLLGKALLLATIGMVSSVAMAEVVVIVNPKNAVASMTAEQVSNVFLGKATDFPGGGAAAPIDLAESSPVREEFYKKVTGKSAAQVKAYWSKQIFSGKGTPPKEVGSSADVKKAVAATPGAIGYIEKAAADDSVKVVHTAP